MLILVCSACKNVDLKFVNGRMFCERCNRELELYETQYANLTEGDNGGETYQFIRDTIQEAADRMLGQKDSD